MQILAIFGIFIFIALAVLTMLGMAVEIFYRRDRGTPPVSDIYEEMDEETT
jgi:hypothetical protein